MLDALPSTPVLVFRTAATVAIIVVGLYLAASPTILLYRSKREDERNECRKERNQTKMG